MRSPFLWACVLLCVSSLSGCGGGATGEPKNRPKRTPVSGILTLNGTPVEGAVVTLHPTQGGNSATGRTDSSGKFVLGTFSSDDGAVPASYGVSVVKLDAASVAPQPAPGEPGYDPNPKTVPPKHLLPEKYSNFTKSGLTKDVGEEPIKDWELKLE